MTHLHILAYKSLLLKVWISYEAFFFLMNVYIELNYVVWIAYQNNYVAMGLGCGRSLVGSFAMNSLNYEKKNFFCTT